MEILYSQKEFDQFDPEAHRTIAQQLKDIKILFLDLHHHTHSSFDLHSDSIDLHSRKLSHQLPINQRKVLKAYLHYHLEREANSTSCNQQPNRREKTSFSFFPIVQNARISHNQNKLLQIFVNWFGVNMKLSRNPTKKKELFFKELSESQELLSVFFERIMQERQSSFTDKKQDHCKVTLMLILITQFNLCLLLLYRRNYSSARLLIENFRVIYEILKKQNQQREDLVLKNLSLIQQLHKEQQKQVRQYLLNNRVNSLRALDSYQKMQEREGVRQAREQAGEEKLNQKYNNAIDKLIKENKSVAYEQERFGGFLEDIGQRMVGLENVLLFEAQTEDIEEKLRARQVKIKLFEHPKLNTAIEISLETNSQSAKSTMSSKIFSIPNPQETYQKVSKPSNNMDLTLKDYFNLCMFMKKTHPPKQTIIYFQILVFHFSKKNLLSAYCLKSDFLDGVDEDLVEEQRLYEEERLARQELAQFVKNEDLVRILLYALVNLVELYEVENAHLWALQTLNYLSRLIEVSIIRVLDKILSRLDIFETPAVEDQLPQGQYCSIQQKQCIKLIKKYSAHVQQIKYKIIKCSFNSLTSQIINQASTTTKKGTQKSINLSRSEIASTVRTSPRQSLNPLSYNMQRLQEKENQLRSLAQSPRNTHQPFDRLYNTGMHSPRDMSERRRAVDGDIDSKRNVMKKKLKGASYQIKKKTTHQRLSHKAQSRNEWTTPTTPVQTIKKLSQKNDLQKQQSVKFNLSQNFESCSNIKTYVSIGMHTVKKKTVNFLDTEKTLDENKKNTRIGELRKKIVENKQELQDRIKLCFQKLNGCLSNANCSTISLDEAHAQNYNFTSQTDEVLAEFNQLLTALKTMRSHAQESAQRQMLIEAKVKLLEMIKPKSRHEKLIEVCVGLVGDINLMKGTEKRMKLKKKILWELAVNYTAVNDSKKCISAYLELARLGDSIGYLKIGEIHMRTKDYQNSIKFHENYATERNSDLSSKVKLAHAYSKVPQYYMKTIDMLNGILIAPGNACRFKEQIVERRHDDQLIQSAVILLSSLHFKNENIEKAIQLCENYCKVNIKNYRVLHILGGYYRFRGNSKKAFECFLNALQNNPAHHKSLIQLTQFICQGADYKSHAIQLLRKCFCTESRNFDLVKTLIKFLVEGSPEQDLHGNNQLSYETLLYYAEILNHSHSRGYSGQNFYQEASLVYEWALNLLDKSVSIANLDQIQQIYRNLGQISFKKGDYARSESYYKLYLADLEKYVTRSCISHQLRQEKIDKTKIHIFHFLAKVKQHQHSYTKALAYFNKSHELQTQYQQKLPHLDSHFHLFELGHCYFMMHSYQNAFNTFTQHRDFLLYFIADFDGSFFRQQRREDMKVSAYLELREKKLPKKKVNYLRQWINGQNQTQERNEAEDKKQTPEEEVEYTLKRNYFQNQLYTAFTCDMRKRFIESKDIYKKILAFIKSAETTAKDGLRMRISGKKHDLREQQQRVRQNYVKHITCNYTSLNADYKGFKKIAMINLANIYRIEGLDSKYEELMRVCVEEFPESLGESEMLRLKVSQKLAFSSGSSGLIMHQTNSSLSSVRQGCMKVFRTTLDNLDRVKTKKIRFMDEQTDNIRESIECFFDIQSSPTYKSSFNSTINA